MTIVIKYEFLFKIAVYLLIEYILLSSSLHIKYYQHCYYFLSKINLVPHNVWSVSYTHLDVYKRQVSVCVIYVSSIWYSHSSNTMCSLWSISPSITLAFWLLLNEVTRTSIIDLLPDIGLICISISVVFNFLIAFLNYLFLLYSSTAVSYTHLDVYKRQW